MNQKLADIGWLVVRAAFGLGFAGFHGWPKVFGGGMARFTQGVAELGFPYPTFFAWAAGLTELVGGALIALGLLTRPAALMGASVMVVALYRHRADPFARSELALLYLAVMVALFLIGGGRFSLDRIIKVRVPVVFRTTPPQRT